MKANDFREHCRQVAYWVDWDKTVDQFMHGDPEAEVRGIAVTWRPQCPPARGGLAGPELRHFPRRCLLPPLRGHFSEDQHHAAKHALMDELGILMRCRHLGPHAQVGIPDAWATSWGSRPSPDR